MADDEQLRTALVEDLDAGFEAVVRTHGDVVHAVARRTADRPADAEDLAAEALLRAYRALRGYDARRIGRLDLRPWLLTILLNTARNDRRDAARRPRTDGAADPPDRPSPVPGPDERAAATDLRERLAVLVAELPVAQRTAVVLRHVVDLPVAEVAAVLACSEGTARSHAARGLAALRARLTPEETS
ncbi:RNA polymerase sigma factor [Actinomycetospora lutea]|uniref:RNA polymerase sigma factor n=1 Tax=Actinomycetospora lutea TaxID=663604 RepID=UPI002366A143|nr:RNA polymerase sigma factor [Actinomycetospora lutea]MDD7939438.1 RNA polymerase sigma factor [Actinomycetospora lutea]